MVLCDAAHRDPATGKFTLLGTFSNFAAPAYPADVSLAVYFAITDGIGPTALRLQLIDARGGAIDATRDVEDSHRILLIKVDVDLQNPLAVLESAVQLQTTLPAAGLYYCELWANDMVLMSRRFTATTMHETGE
jgi:hypothetical protein